MDYLGEAVDTMIQVWRLYRRQSHVSFKDKATTILQHHSLNYLQENSKITQKDFASHFDMSASSAAQFIERLVKAGYIKRHKDNKDRRIVQLSITKRGEKEIFQMRAIKREKIKNLFGKIPLGDLKEFLRINKNLLKTMRDKK